MFYRLIKKNNLAFKLLLICSVLLLPGCAVVVKKAGSNISSSLTEVIMNHDDLGTVREAMPAYMLLMDSFINRHPDSPETYATAANLYSAYAGLVPQDEKRRVKRLSDRARDYALKSLCLEEDSLCDVNNMAFDKFEQRLGDADLETELLFTVASTWAGWIQNNQSDWNAIAQLPKVKALMERSVAQDETYNHGQGHMYMGVLESLVPPSAGGDLEKAREHFEKSIEISDGKNLMAKVLYAKNYARMLFDEELHNKLVSQVLAADAEAEGLTLMNMVAKKEAKELEQSAQEYFQ